MHIEVSRRLDRLCDRYEKAQAELVLAQPNVGQSGRRLRKSRSEATHSLYMLQRRRKPAGANLVKLAYVRGMRSVVPKASLGEEHLAEIRILQETLDNQLYKLEVGALVHFQHRVRRLKLAGTLRDHTYPEATIRIVEHVEPPFPLQQRARASLQNTLEAAERAGAESARRVTGYDGEAHVR